MFRCVGRVITIFALCCAIGVHWVALQSVAWTTMVFEYSKHAPLCRAIAQTFDGAHPCGLCQVVNKGNNSEKKSDLQSPTWKVDIICVVRAIRVMPPFARFEYATTIFSFPTGGHPPPVPPPRQRLS